MHRGKTEAVAEAATAFYAACLRAALSNFHAEVRARVACKQAVTHTLRCMALVDYLHS
jgi:hypothetical protein